MKMRISFASRQLLSLTTGKKSRRTETEFMESPKPTIRGSFAWKMLRVLRILWRRFRSFRSSSETLGVFLGLLSCTLAIGCTLSSMKDEVVYETTRKNKRSAYLNCKHMPVVIRHYHFCFIFCRGDVS